MRLYQYTLLHADGTSDELEPRPQMDLKELYEVLGCSTIEVVPTIYYAKKGWGKCTVYVDEEGRFDESNERNKHFHVEIDPNGAEFDIVGLALREKLIKESK